MSRRFLNTFTIMNAATLDASATSETVQIQYIDQISLQITSDNTSLVGQWSVEASLDEAVWVPISGLSIAATTAGVNDSIIIDMKLLSFPYIRVVFTATSGSGTGTVKVSGKGLS